MADIYINTFPYFGKLSRKKRFARDTAVLHATGSTVDPYNADFVDKKEAKKALGIAGDTTVLLTMGTGYYFKPAFGYDFFRTGRRILDRFDNVTLLFVGLSKKDRMIPRRMKKDARAAFYGPMADPAMVFKAADLFLESFPMPALGSVTLAAAIGEAFPVLMYGDSENIVRVDRSMLFKGVHRARSESDYVASVSDLISNPAATRDAARQIREHIAASDSLFSDRLISLYDKIDEHTHTPGEIPPGSFGQGSDNLLLASQSMPFRGLIEVVRRN